LKGGKEKKLDMSRWEARQLKNVANNRMIPENKIYKAKDEERIKW
jgi:hypothetical protein